MKPWICLFFLVLSSMFAGRVVSGTTLRYRGAVGAERAPATTRPPVRFEENRGQYGARARFVARCGAFDAVFTSDDVALIPASDPAASVRLRLGGSIVTGERRLPGTTNYLRGRDPQAWHTNVPSYAAVRYVGVAAGIDAVFYGTANGIEYDLVVAAGADPDAVTIDVAGASDLSIDADGALVAHTPAGEMRHGAPRIYQDTARGRQAVPGRYVIVGAGRARVHVGAFDPALPLVVDPQVGFSAVFGGTGFDYPGASAIDANGDIYIAGATTSPGFASANAADDSLGGLGDGFVAKLAADGSSLVFATYFGGSDVDRVSAIAVDRDGNAYVAGETESTDLPTTPGAFQRTPAGDTEAFVAKIAPSGDAIVYATYLGGALRDQAYGIGVDAAGDAVVVGRTRSTDFPTVNAFQPAFGGDPSDAFVTKLDANGSSLVFSSYLGGGPSRGSGDEAVQVALDAAGDAVIVGNTSGSDFPTMNAIQPSARGAGDGFVTKMSTTGQLVFSTYLGGTDADFMSAVTVDESGDVYVGGSTYSADFPMVSPFQSSNHGGSEGFVVKLGADGAGPLFASYLGGSAYDAVFTLAADAEGNLIAAGRTQSTNFPVVDPVQAAFAGVSDAFIAKVDSSGSSLTYSSYLGGAGDDQILDVAVALTGNAYAVGNTSSPDFPTTAGALHQVNGDYDVFVTKLLTPLDPDFRLTPSPSVLTLARGQKSTVDIDITRIGGFEGGVTVIAPDAAALKLKVKPPSGATSGARVTFVIKVKKKASVGATQLVFEGRDAADRVRTATFDLVIQ